MKPVAFSEEGSYRAMLELARQYEPRNVVREYVTNGLDALLDNDQREIKVAVVPSFGRVMITDNGMGMSPEKLASVPYSIGESEKAGMVDKRGEKALGILAFASIADNVTLITRQQNVPVYSLLRMEVRNEKRVMFEEVKQITEAEVANFYGAKLPHGTCVVIDRIRPEILDKAFTVAGIRNQMSRLYTPAIEEGCSIKVGKIDKNGRPQMELVESIKFPGEPIKEIEIEAGMDNDQNKLLINGKLFFNPEGTGDKVMVYSKNVLVYPSILDIPGFERSKFWGCGKLTGYVDDNFTKLRLGRDGIDMTTKQYKLWLESLQTIEENLNTLVEERMKKIPRERETASIQKVWETLADVYKNIQHGPDLKSPLFIRASVSGKDRRVIGASPLEDEIIPGIRKEKGKTSIDGDGKSGGTFIEDPSGNIEKVVRRSKKFALNYPTPTNFASSEKHLRSKLDTRLGIPSIYINSGHPDYATRFATGKTDDTMLRYIAYLCSKEVANAEARLAVQQKTCSIEEALQLASSKSEEINFAILRALKIK